MDLAFLELEVSREYLKAYDYGVAVMPDGRAKVVTPRDATPTGASRWTPDEMWALIIAETSHERRLLMGLKALR